MVSTRFGLVNLIPSVDTRQGCGDKMRQYSRRVMVIITINYRGSRSNVHSVVFAAIKPIEIPRQTKHELRNEGHETKIDTQLFVKVHQMGFPPRTIP